MVKVVVLGAHGQVAQIVERFLFADKDVDTTLFLRNAERMADKKSQATIIEGSATDAAQLEKAMKGQDIVYANLGGQNDVDLEAEAVIEAMDASTIYEVPLKMLEEGLDIIALKQLQLLA